MSKAVAGEIAALLGEAYEQGRCLVPSETPGVDDRLRRALSRHVAAGDVVSPMRGLYADARDWAQLSPSDQVLFRARGMQELHPEWVFCGPTAALAWGLDVSESLLGRLHIGCTHGNGHGATDEICRHTYRPEELTGANVEIVDGLRVTEPSQTVFDCLRWSDFPRALGIADSALRTALVDRDALERFIEERRPRTRGRTRALGALGWADERSENGGESIARARMLLLGYVAPELQVAVPKVKVAGAPWRADYCWVRSDGGVILGELDGRCKYADEKILAGRSSIEALADERMRESRISLYDVAVMRFSFELTGHPSEFAALLDAYGVPRRGSVEALPPGEPMVPDWNRLRRRSNS